MKFARPPYVVVDTTELRADLTLDTRWTATIAAGSYGLLHLRIPNVVRLESIRHHDRMVSDGEREALKGLNVVRRYAPDPEYVIDAREITQICDQIRVEFPHMLEYTVERANGAFLDTPQVDHDTVLARAMQGRKPFDTNGKEGYRDALIWYSILELCRTLHGSDHLLFVTGNSRDFCDDKSGSLAQALRDDLDQLESPPTVTLFPTLKALHDTCSDALNALRPARDRPYMLMPAPPQIDGLYDRISNLCEALIGTAIPSVDLPTPFDHASLPSELSDVFVRDIEEIEGPEMGAPVTPIIDDVVTREVIQAAHIILDGVLDEAGIVSYPSSEVDELSIIGPTSTPGVSHVRVARVALLTFQVTYNVTEGSITQIRLAHVMYALDVDPPES